MSRKRRQRSTKIRKRAEKKQREEAKAKKRQAKMAGKGSLGLLSMDVDTEVAEVCVKSLVELEARLAPAPIRGWSINDMQQEYGLSWLAKTLGEAIEANDGNESLHIEYPEDAKGPIWDQLEALDRAAPGLQVEWDEGFPELARAIGDSLEVPEDEPEEDEEDEDDDEDDDGDDDGDDDSEE